jgi:8-oxo-dGTP pyrophosphatase MutT (NUDIX family)
MENRPQEYFFLKQDARGEDYIASFDEVLILPIDRDGSVLFAREVAPALDGIPVLILPGGTVEPNEDLHITANRELQEEIGMRANQLLYLGEFWPWPKYLGVRSHLYLATDLVPSRLDGDEAQPIETVRVSWQEAERMVRANELHDTRAIAALYRARLAQQP